MFRSSAAGDTRRKTGDVRACNLLTGGRMQGDVANGSDCRFAAAAASATTAAAAATATAISAAAASASATAAATSVSHITVRPTSVSPTLQLGLHLSLSHITVRPTSVSLPHYN